MTTRSALFLQRLLDPLLQPLQAFPPKISSVFEHLQARPLLHQVAGE